jgi:hypothetical protein
MHGFCKPENSGQYRGLAPFMNQKTGAVLVRGGAVYYSDRRAVVTSKYGLLRGSKYLVPTIFGSSLLTITKVDYSEGRAEAESGSLRAILNHGEDSRGCWTSELSMNKDAVVRVQVV